MINLKNIPSLKQTFGIPVGFSDHSLGTAIPLAAVALGACVIEKHFTLDKNMAGWDHAISSDPQELSYIVDQTRNIFQALGDTRRKVSDAELDKRLKFRRSLVARTKLKQGHTILESDIDFKRPGTGISPHELKYVVGRKLANDIGSDQVINWNDLC